MRRFKLDNVNYVLLTYSDCPNDFDPQLIIDAVVGTGAVYRLGRELHQNGKPHYHCFVQWDDGYSTPDAAAVFNVGGRKANIKRFSANPGRRWDYVGKYANQKEGHYIIGDQCERPGGDKEDSERSQSDIWSEIINATSQSEFFEKLAALAPKQLGCSFSSLKLYADWKYRPEQEEYISPIGRFEVPEVLSDWVVDNLESEVVGMSCPSFRRHARPLSAFGPRPPEGGSCCHLHSRTPEYTMIRGICANLFRKTKGTRVVWSD